MRNFADELGFPSCLDLHSIRRADATNVQVEYGYDVSFVQLQLGHEHASTTSIGTNPRKLHQMGDQLEVA